MLIARQSASSRGTIVGGLSNLASQNVLLSGATLNVRHDGDKLRAQLTGQPSFQVFPESETNFFYRVVDAQLTFVKDSNGKVTELVLHQNGDKSAHKTSDELGFHRNPF